MKHTLKVTNLLILIFVFAQIMGLIIISEYIDIKESSLAGKAVIKEDVYEHSVGGVPPEIENKYITVAFILFSILVGTLILLMIIKYRMGNIMKIWFFIAIVFCLAKAFSPFTLKIINYIIPTAIKHSGTIAIIIASIFAYLKLFRNNIIIHNFTEVFLYGGLAAFIVPNLDIKVVFILLIGISLYDMYAVWKSKHMVKMAKFQSSQKMFAGLMIPYKKLKHSISEDNIKIQIENIQTSKTKERSEKSDKKIKDKNKSKQTQEDTEEVKTAILGGGDIAFPLIFSGVVLVLTGSFLNSIIITITTTIALALLLIKGQQNKFYPAMPFISAGCFAGYAIVWLRPIIGL